MFSEPDKNSWEAALSRLLGDEYAFVANGPRRHAQWQHDALAVMGRQVPDPRGWKKLEWANWEYEHDKNPYYPFRDHPIAELITAEAHPIQSLAAHQLLVLLTDQSFRIGSFSLHEKNEDQYRADALTVLARYGPDAKFFTTSQDAETTTSPDFSREARHGYMFSNYIAEIGMIVVSETEVGVFWSFDAEAEFE